MPQPYKGTRVRATVRLPLDVAMNAASQAAGRRWSMSEFIAWCVERQLSRAQNGTARTGVREDEPVSV